MQGGVPNVELGVAGAVVACVTHEAVPIGMTYCGKMLLEVIIGAGGVCETWTDVLSERLKEKNAVEPITSVKGTRVLGIPGRGEATCRK